jgi:choline-sulfatase
VTDNALAWMDRAESPFLARLSYLQPHTPVCPPPPFDTLYDPACFRDHFRDDGQTSVFEQRFAETIDASNFSPRDIQLTQSYYYGLAAWVDSQVGRLLDFLEERGLAERTIVVFDADHGAALGEGGGRYAKHVFAPEVHRVPRIIRWPGTLPGGEVRAEVTESLDLPRTLFGLCGIEAPESFAGRNVFGDPPAQAVYATIGFGTPAAMAFPNGHRGRYLGDRGWPRRSCIRTSRWRLDRNVRIDGRPVSDDDRDVILCDVQADPLERTNVADDPQLADVRADLEARLDAHIAGAAEPEGDPAASRDE